MRVIQKGLVFQLLLFVFSRSFAGTGKYTSADKTVFSENKGQVRDQFNRSRPDVLFSGSDGQLVYHLKKDGLSYQTTNVDTWKEEQDIKTHAKIKTPDQVTIYRIDINWLHCNPGVSIETKTTLPGYQNYFSNSFPGGVTDVQSYNEITYRNIYKGIDLKWYSNNGQLEYDYLISAGSDYTQIKHEIKGAEKLFINPDGNLIIKTPSTEIAEHAPLVIQNGKKLKAHWMINGNVVSFNIEQLDPELPFTIDPITRIWATYYGGNGVEAEGLWGVATDASGNIYACGRTSTLSGTAIATVGSHQSTYAGGFGPDILDAFLVKFDSNGVRQWGTYYGGAKADRSYSCATDLSGNIYLSGYTTSVNGTSIATAGSYQPIAGGSFDAFLVKFNTNGVRLWGTYYGGTGADYALSCTTDISGNVFLAGYTASTNGIASTGSHQGIYGTGLYDAFLVKFDGNGIRQWGTYYGGTGDDRANGCTVDALGNVYLTGTTDSPSGTVIATTGSHQDVFNGGDDAFLVKFNSAGVRQWGTYYGASGTDEGNGCATDVSGNVYLTGTTTSSTSTAIATTASHQPNYGGISDSYLVKFDAAGIRQWGTYYGGTSVEEGYACCTDNAGHIFICGYSMSDTGTAVATTGSFQPINGGFQDGYLAVFNNAGVRLEATYYGAGGTEYAFACASDGFGSTYLGGSSGTPTGLSTPGCHQPISNGNNDGILAKFNGFTQVTSVFNPDLTSKENLIQAIPNPVFTVAKIYYQLPAGINQGEIVIYTVEGKLIKSYSVTSSLSLISLSADELPGGAYFYSLQTRSYTEIKKLFIIK